MDIVDTLVFPFLHNARVIQKLAKIDPLQNQYVYPTSVFWAKTPKPVLTFHDCFHDFFTLLSACLDRHRRAIYQAYNENLMNPRVNHDRLIETLQTTDAIRKKYVVRFLAPILHKVAHLVKTYGNHGITYNAPDSRHIIIETTCPKFHTWINQMNRVRNDIMCSVEYRLWRRYMDCGCIGFHGYTIPFDQMLPIWKLTDALVKIETQDVCIKIGGWNHATSNIGSDVGADDGVIDEVEDWYDCLIPDFLDDSMDE